jgi:hypothetical protein
VAPDGTASDALKMPSWFASFAFVSVGLVPDVELLNVHVPFGPVIVAADATGATDAATAAAAATTTAGSDRRLASVRRSVLPI